MGWKNRQQRSRRAEGCALQQSGQSRLLAESPPSCTAHVICAAGLARPKDLHRRCTSDQSLLQKCVAMQTQVLPDEIAL